MANFYGTERTNYFRVTDEEKYNALFKRLCTDTGDKVFDFTKTDNNGNILHGFGAYGCIEFGPERKDSEELEDDEEEYEDYEGGMDTFYELLTEILPEGEAFIQVCIGNEKLRYLTAETVVVTRYEIQFFNAQKMAMDWALENTGVLPTEAKH